MTEDLGLENIPYIGPARRAALIAANVTTRTELARASVEQLVSITGMQRTLAEKTLAALAPAVADTPRPPAEEVLPPPAFTADDPIVTPVLSEVDHALAVARTALADATRAEIPPKLLKSLTRLAVLFDRLGKRTANLSSKRQKRVAILLNGLNARLRKISPKKMTAKREERLCDRLRNERRALIEAASLSTKRPR